MRNQIYLRGRFAPKKRATWPTMLAQIVTLAVIGAAMGAILANGF